MHEQQLVLILDDDANLPDSPLSRSKVVAVAPADDLRVAENVLLYQRETGGWPKNYDREQALTETQRRAVLNDRSKNDSTIDNGATHTEIRLLAKAFQKTKDDRYEQAALRGIRYLLGGQYDNGGWPQRFPAAQGYAQYITFNDNALIGVLSLLRDIADGKEAFAFVPDELRAECGQAVQRGRRQSACGLAAMSRCETIESSILKVTANTARCRSATIASRSV